MLGRYRIARGQPLSALPARVRKGVRIDTRKHTNSFLRPTAAMVEAMLSGPPEGHERRFRTFARDYRRLLAERFREDRAPFDELHRLALEQDVFLGCNCPTARQPDVRHCHTSLALEYLARKYPDLDVRFDAR